MKAVTFENLKRETGDETVALAVYKKVCDIGGFGNIGSDFANGYPALDVSGLPEAKQKRIEEVIAEASAEKEPEKPAEKSKKEGTK